MASFYPQNTVIEEPEEDTDENTVSNTVSTPTTNETVMVEVYVGRISVKKANVSKAETNWTYSYTSSGVEEVQINIDGTQEYREDIDFSAGDTTINVSK